MSDCVFCEIVAGDSPANIVARSGLMSNSWENWTAFTPLNPHAPGHVLFIPDIHMSDATEDPAATYVHKAAVRYVAENNLQANIITSIGPLATQSVFHYHVHVIPRWSKDDLPTRWPWVSWPTEAYENPEQFKKMERIVNRVRALREAYYNWSGNPDSEYASSRQQRDQLDKALGIDRYGNDVS